MMTLLELQEHCKCLTDELESVKEEDCVLKGLLKKHGIEYASAQTEARKGEETKETEAEKKVYSDVQFPSVKLSVEERVALFRSLFRGREDVFAKRWFSAATGKGGYQPVCINEWRRGVCEKKEHKCAECPNRSFAPLGYNDIYNHLEGKDEGERDVVGLYAIDGLFASLRCLGKPMT